jgi:hypothetical protein
VYAAAEYRSLPGRDAELCRAASHTDWLYMAGTLVLDGVWIAAEQRYFGAKNPDGTPTVPQPGIRLIGPTVMGALWGQTLGVALLSRPQCDPDDIHWAPPEGNVHTELPLLFATALAAAATGGFAANISHPIQTEWPVWERATGTVLPIVTGFAGTFLPLLLPPRPYRAMQELQKLRLGADKTGATLGWGFTF